MVVAFGGCLSAEPISRRRRRTTSSSFVRKSPRSSERQQKIASNGRPPRNVSIVWSSSTRPRPERRRSFPVASGPWRQSSPAWPRRLRASPRVSIRRRRQRGPDGRGERRIAGRPRTLGGDGRAATRDHDAPRRPARRRAAPATVAFNCALVPASLPPVAVTPPPPESAPAPGPQPDSPLPLPPRLRRASPAPTRGPPPSGTRRACTTPATPISAAATTRWPSAPFANSSGVIPTTTWPTTRSTGSPRPISAWRIAT